MLLKEVRVLTDLQVISESRETGVMCIRGTFQRAEEANHNQRVYPKAVLENCVKSLTEKLSGRELVGELDHPADGVVKLQNASHLITKLEWQGNDLIGEAEILPTPAGQIAKSLINAGVKIGISSRGMGTLSESVKGAKIVNDDYKMITFDLVADPSTKGAYPSLAESRQHAIDFVENVIKPAISEKAFVARLKKKLDEAKKENNPWAICTAQVGREDKAKYERCVKKVKGKKKIDEMCGPKHSKKKGLKKMKRQMENSSRIPLTLPRLEEGLAGFATRMVRDPLRAMQQQRMMQRAGGFVGKGLGKVAGGAIGGLGGSLIGKGAAGMKRGASFGKKVGGAVGDVAGQAADGAARITQQELLNPTVAGAKKADSYLGKKAAQSATGIKTAAKMASAKAKPFVKGAMNKAAFKAGQFTRKGLDLFNRGRQARNVTRNVPMGGPAREEKPAQAQTPTFGAVPGGQTTPRPAGNLRRVKAKVD